MSWHLGEEVSAVVTLISTFTGELCALHFAFCSFIRLSTYMSIWQGETNTIYSRLQLQRTVALIMNRYFFFILKMSTLFKKLLYNDNVEFFLTVNPKVNNRGLTVYIKAFCGSEKPFLMLRNVDFLNWCGMITLEFSFNY